MPLGRRLAFALAAGLISGAVCYTTLFYSRTEGDFFAALRMARDMLTGADPYRYATGPDLVSYPLPAGMVALPFAWLPDPLASAVFMAVSGGLLAWLLMRQGEAWPLGMLFSWPFVYALFFAQWTPLIASLWFLPAALPLVLIKPQSALPLALASGRLSRTGLGLAAGLGILSLVLMPDWPWRWLAQVGGYQGFAPPLFSMPLGPLILLVLLRWRDRRAWLVLALAMMPQRVVYDQLALLLAAPNRRALAVQAALSWLTLPALLVFGGWTELPGGWPTWILATLYLPAIGVVLWGGDEAGDVGPV